MQKEKQTNTPDNIEIENNQTASKKTPTGVNLLL